jgi:hypothetical protein
MAILTKSSILQGINEIKKVEIKELNGEIWLRPLSSAEVNEVLNIEAEGYGNFEANTMNRNAQAKGKMNLAKMQKASNKSQYEAIYKSINNEKNPDEWTHEELYNLPRKAITEIYEKVMELSGVDATEVDAKNFPEDK